MKYTQTITALALTISMSLQISASVFAASEIVPLDNVVKDFLWFDNEGDIREISITQTHNTVTENGITTYYNLYGDAIMQRVGNGLTINLETNEKGEATSWSEATLSQGPDGEFVSGFTHYKIINGKKVVTKSVSSWGDRFNTYDEDGRLISRIYKKKDANGNVSSAQEYDYTYDEQGDQVLQYTLTNKDSSGNITSTHKHDYTYDENGNRTSQFKTTSWRGGATSSYGYDYTYDENGNQTSTVFKPGTSRIGSIRENRSTYDADGNRTSFIETTRNSDSSNLLSSKETTDTYDTNGNNTSNITEYKDANGNITRSIESDSTYDQNGNQTSEIFEYKDANGNGHFREYDYTYDENGNNISKISEYKDANGNITLSIEYDYTYDENGNQTSEIFEYKDANGNGHFREYDYTYDENGNQTSKIQTNKDGDGNITGSAVEDFTYEGENQISSSTIKDANGNIIGTTEEVLSGSIGSYKEIYYDDEGRPAYVYTDSNFSYGEAELSDGELSSFSGSNVEYITYEDDGSSTKTTISTTNEGAASTENIDTTWLKDFSSSIESLNSENYTPAGAYTGYQKTDLDYDADGNLTGSTKTNYTGDQGSEVYSGKTEYGGYLYNDDNKVSDYTKTTYDANDDVTETTVYSGIQYDSYGRKTQASYSTTDAAGTITGSGTKTY